MKRHILHLKKAKRRFQKKKQMSSQMVTIHLLKRNKIQMNKVNLEMMMKQTDIQKRQNLQVGGDVRNKPKRKLYQKVNLRKQEGGGKMQNKRLQMMQRKNQKLQKKSQSPVEEVGAKRLRQSQAMI